MAGVYPGPSGRRRAIQLRAVDARALLQSTLPYLLATLTPEQLGRVQKVLDAAVVDPVLDQEYDVASRRHDRDERAHGIYHDQYARPTESSRMRRIEDEYIHVVAADKHILVQHWKLLAHDALKPLSDNPDEAAYLSRVMHTLSARGVYLRIEPRFVRNPDDPSAWIVGRRDFDAWLSLGFDGDVIPTKDGRLTRDSLLDTTSLGAGYYRHVVEGTCAKLLDQAAERVRQMVTSGRNRHQDQARTRDSALIGVVAVSDFLGDADFPPATMWDMPWSLYLRGRDLAAAGHYAESGKVNTYAAIFAEIATKRLNDYIDATVRGAARVVGALTTVAEVAATVETALIAWSLAGLAIRIAAGGTVATAAGTAADRAVFEKMLQASGSGVDRLQLDVLDRAVGWSDDVTKVFDTAARAGRDLSEAQIDELCKTADAKWGNPGRWAAYVRGNVTPKAARSFSGEVTDGVKRYFSH